eukprot:5930208-Lingulodinium_polyedra.AAC.1
MASARAVPSPSFEGGCLDGGSRAHLRGGAFPRLCSGMSYWPLGWAFSLFWWAQGLLDGLLASF